ncbi:MAG: NDP-sugar synthase [Vicinamibacterales bacterium]|mgnify:FL=1|nr:NDP-sugar synthase [Vicinamibacterales bacterium]
MKAILLAGGKGTRLRPLTLHTPKPIVPIFNRPFLLYQLDLLRQIPSIDEVILSLNYQPGRIEDLIGDGHDLGVKIRYVVEPAPLGTGGAVKYAEPYLDDAVVVFNGDVLTQIDLAAVLRLHREREARATIVLSPVENPSAYGLVETDDDANVKRFLEKPKADEITCNTINAGIYIIEPDTLDRIPKETHWSIERSYFPSLIERGERFVAYVSSGYWIDIGTPDKYRQVHRDIMDGRFAAAPFGNRATGTAIVAKTAKVDPGARLEGPCFIDEGVTVKADAQIGPYTVLGRDCKVKEGARLDGAILWPYGEVEAGATVSDAILGRGCQIGENAIIGAGTILGDKSVITEYGRSGR